MTNTRPAGPARLALRMAIRAKRFLRGPRTEPLAAATCAPLLRDGLLRPPLDLRTIRAVTDFHVPGQPGGVGAGLRPESLERWLGLGRVDVFTYQFHGDPWNLLREKERDLERHWPEEGDPHGQLFASAWRA